MKPSMYSIICAALALLCGALISCSTDQGEKRDRERQVHTASGNPVLLAAGDISTCDGEGDTATAKLLGGERGTVLALGDNAYEQGSETNYDNCYDPTWGLYKDRTRPVPGNHEYSTADASGYFDYFKKAAGDPDEGYYSYDVGGWHIVALNSSCEEIGGCGDESPQVRWLEEDLASSGGECTLAYFHHPLFASKGEHGGSPKVESLWEALYDSNADVILNGHEHSYQRFAPQDPDGRADQKRGIREFVVGTGGGRLYKVTDEARNSEIYNDEVHGVLKLTLKSGGYGWEFLSAGGGEFEDSGSGECH